MLAAQLRLILPKFYDLGMIMHGPGVVIMMQNSIGCPLIDATTNFMFSHQMQHFLI